MTVECKRLRQHPLQIYGNQWKSENNGKKCIMFWLFSLATSSKRPLYESKYSMDNMHVRCPIMRQLNTGKIGSREEHFVISPPGEQ